jgi:hypothetical protein
MHTGPNIERDGLVFGYDTGYPLVSGSSDTYKFNKGEPTTTFDVGSMRPTSPNSFFTSSAVYHSNLHGTVWDWTYYPNSNISDDGGMEWHPEVEGPGFKGAWLMKKRPGGNSESNFSGTAPGALDETSSYTVSVWCKTDQASCFRIHINTTKNGSSYWGYASGYHSGGGGWERLSVTVPANEGNTNIGAIRCQAIGTAITADAYFRNYQVEKNTHPTPFLLGGTRSVSGSLIDLTRTTDIDLSNVSFDSNAQITFDGTDDRIYIPNSTFTNPTELTIESVFKRTSALPDAAGCPIHRNDGSNGNVGNSEFTIAVYRDNSYYIYGSIGANTGTATWTNGYTGVICEQDIYYHVTSTWDGSNVRTYVNGDLKVTYSLTTYSNSGGNIRFGTSSDNGGTYRWLGEIPITKIYNRALTAQEVQQNYRAYKNRFDL